MKKDIFAMVLDLIEALVLGIFAIVGFILFCLYSGEIFNAFTTI